VGELRTSQVAIEVEEGVNLEAQHEYRATFEESILQTATIAEKIIMPKNIMSKNVENDKMSHKKRQN